MRRASRLPSALALALSIAAALPALAGAAPAAAPRLKVGVTLHPYYSWTRNVVGDLPVEVRPILPESVDAGSYQPSPEDVRKLTDLDAIVVNGVGHDDFITAMIAASGNARIVVIRPNEGTPLLATLRGGTTNSHTFISITNAIQQSYVIERALAKLLPEHSATLHANAAGYARRLRAMSAAALASLAGAKRTRVVTVHDGYGYLLQELGVEVAAVVEPSHGLLPSAKELEEVVTLCRREKVAVVLAEEGFPAPMLDVLREAGARAYVIGHIATGRYNPEKFEVEMKANLDAIVKALVTD